MLTKKEINRKNDKQFLNEFEKCLVDKKYISMSEHVKFNDLIKRKNKKALQLLKLITKKV
jgi:hypothetical protein